MTTIGQLRREFVALQELRRRGTSYEKHALKRTDQDWARIIAHIFARGIADGASEDDQAAAMRVGRILYQGDDVAFAGFLQDMKDTETDRQEERSRRTAMGGIGVIDVTGMA